jgi:type III secretion protein J
VVRVVKGLNMSGWRRVLLPFVLGCSLLVAGCGSSELYTKLSETQANEMLAVLSKSGVAAGKVDNGEEGWALTADPSDFPKAIEVLRAQGYPKQDFATLGTVFKKEGFVSSQTEERARLLYGMSQELSHTVSEIDGVIEARVHLAIPEVDPLSDTPKPPSASVFIKHRPNVPMDDHVGKVKALVVNAVEGLAYDKVSVVTFPAQPLASLPPAKPSPVMFSLKVFIIAGSVLFFVFVLYPALRRHYQLRRLPVPRDANDRERGS